MVQYLAKSLRAATRFRKRLKPSWNYAGFSDYIWPTLVSMIQNNLSSCLSLTTACLHPVVCFLKLANRAEYEAIAKVLCADLNVHLVFHFFLKISFDRLAAILL